MYMHTYACKIDDIEVLPHARSMTQKLLRRALMYTKHMCMIISDKHMCMSATYTPNMIYMNFDV